MAVLTAGLFINNDMRARLDGLQSSTMPSGIYLNNSTGLTLDLWSGRSTSTGVRVLGPTNMPYVGGNGRYDYTIQSTAHGLKNGAVGFIRAVLFHQGINGDWRQNFVVGPRGST